MDSLVGTRSLRYRLCVFAAIAGLIGSALLPELHVHVQQNAGGVRVATVHRHEAPHRAAEADRNQHRIGTQHPDDDDDVVWIAADQGDLGSATAFVTPLVAILAGVLVPDAPSDWAHVASSPVATFHDPPGLLVAPRAPPQFS